MVCFKSAYLAPITDPDLSNCHISPAGILFDIYTPVIV